MDGISIDDLSDKKSSNNKNKSVFVEENAKTSIPEKEKAFNIIKSLHNRSIKAIIENNNTIILITDTNTTVELEYNDYGNNFVVNNKAKAMMK